ncbi:MAG: hypothetical protein ACTSR3_05655 [Candidatus Helarchaeota archaeon]
MSISLTKTIPASDWYTDTGSTTITLAGANRIIVNSKKALIKIPIPQSSATQASNPSDKGKNYVKDLKKIEDTIKIGGWLIDKTDSSAWQQAWQLRAMSASGGPLSNLTIENLTFGTGSQQAIAYPLRAKGVKINETSSDTIDVARIEVDLSIYLGDER